MEDSRRPLVDADRAAEIGPRKPAQTASRQVYDGRVVHLSVDSVRFPDGSDGELELVRHAGAAAILPITGDDAADPEILLIRQFRYAAGGDIYEVPAGVREPGEDWERCARRELEEETALVPGRLELLTTIYTTPGFTDERIRLYLATDVRPGTRALDDDEFVHPVRMRLSEALDHVRSGRIIDGKTICSLLYVAQFRR